MKSTRTTLVLAGVAVSALVSASPRLVAGTNGFVVPAFRGAANSESGYWENFTTAVGAPGNLPDQPGATTDAVLTQTNPAGLVTGSGNLYCTDIASFGLQDTTPFTSGTVALQARTLGSEVDYASVALVYTNDLGEHAVRPLFRYELSRATVPGLGYGVSSLWQWDLTGLGVTRFTVYFRAAGPHTSFDSLTLDTADRFARVFPQQPFVLKSSAADLARWMYPFNGSPANRPTASVFGASGSTPAFDSRDAQFLLGWHTANRIPAGHGASNYLVRGARVTLTIASGGQYAYQGTLRDYRSYFPTNDPRYLAPAATNVPVELFGAGYRGGYTAATFPQDGPWGVNPGVFYTNRTVYAAGFDTHGALVDVSNNVGDDGTNEIAGPFEVAPFAVGQTTNVAEGQLMPLGSRLTFELNLDDPLICGYVQRGLDEGNLGFVACSLIAASFSGPPNYPNFYTSFSPLATADQYPVLDLEGGIVRANIDSDGDGLPDDWENFYIGSLAGGPADDGDGDGLSNFGEYLAGASPNAAASQLQVLAIQHETNTAELHFTFASGRQYEIGRADSPTAWQTVTNPALSYVSAWLAKTTTNVTYPAPVYAVWRDTMATNTQRFYRVGAR